MNDSAHQLHRQIHESKGMAYLNRCKGRSFSLNILEGNFRELKECCRLIETPDVGVRLMSLEHHAEGVQAHRESMRLFHNFLASAKSLVDHTRVFVEANYAGTSIEGCYNERVKQTFAEDPLCKFVHDLRNYMLHKGLPGCQMSVEAKKVGPHDQVNFESTVTLKKDSLLEWDGWSSVASEYLESAPTQLRLSTIAAEYGHKVLAFHKWFDAALNDFHTQDLNELRHLQECHARFETAKDD